MASPSADLCPAARELSAERTEVATLRAYLRQRERLVEYAAVHIQHMQKALIEMNLQFHHVVSDITGVTGMKITRAIISSERDPDVLASLRDVRCHSSVETIRAPLIGKDRDEQVFALSSHSSFTTSTRRRRWSATAGFKRRLLP
ncbi:hypothetical protein [Agrobacterium tumefaciens]|uniref:hypothetical protein n=1 Tax=Agrobacterium tumefaciens TaxID=358 RepID=UPI0013A69155|nr:hypothetical protein [Rhizobium nepotum]NSY09456.1 hypothetical protein [Agrobacterium tumefaciens]NSZ09224.1 hypothetical protein [Agrobacterium tumefaciens]NTC81091.1 hypothetical protein [Agrobacterium tumefaciens]NTD09564.1 hypothetical protein [Agrobacterium tumefaciens]